MLTFFLPDVFGNPSHHVWFDWWSSQWLPAVVNAHGQPNDTIFWGIKNYVEGGNYLGIVTWLLAAVAVGFTIYDLRFTKRLSPPASRLYSTCFFAVLALVSLLFAFGTPLYALLFYGLPGWNQLHSPFRWVFPFTVSMACWVALGCRWCWRWGGGGDKETRRQGDRETGRGGARPRFFSATLGVLTGLIGLGVLLLVMVSGFMPQFFINLGQRFVNGSDLAQNAFADGRMFWSYEALNLAKFGLFALLSGGLVWWVGVGLGIEDRRQRTEDRGRSGERG